MRSIILARGHPSVSSTTAPVAISDETSASASTESASEDGRVDSEKASDMEGVSVAEDWEVEEAATR